MYLAKLKGEASPSTLKLKVIPCSPSLNRVHIFVRQKRAQSVWILQGPRGSGLLGLLSVVIIDSDLLEPVVRCAAVVAHVATSLSQICSKLKVVAQLGSGRREARLLKIFLLPQRKACPQDAPAPWHLNFYNEYRLEELNKMIFDCKNVYKQ